MNLMSRSPEQNFEVIESADVLEQENGSGLVSGNSYDNDSSFIVTRSGINSNANNNLEPLEQLSPSDFPHSPHSLDGFHTVSAPASLVAVSSDYHPLSDKWATDKVDAVQEPSSSSSTNVPYSDSALGMSIVIIPMNEVAAAVQDMAARGSGTTKPQFDMADDVVGDSNHQQISPFSSVDPVSVNRSNDWEIMNRPSSSSAPMPVASTLLLAPAYNNNRPTSIRPPARPQQQQQQQQNYNNNPLGGGGGATNDEDNGDSSIADKFKLFWNNARYQLKVSTTGLSESQPICLLGRVYGPKHPPSSDDLLQAANHNSRGRSSKNSKQLLDRSHFEKFKLDFRSRIWITYRQNFTPLPNSDIISDLGWGCMIRSGQMMLAQAFLYRKLGRNWHYYAGEGDDDPTMPAHRQIIRWFGDAYDKLMCPFSIHHLTELSQQVLSKKPGDWFGPSSIATVLRKALQEAGEINPEIGKIGMYVASDCTVFLGDIQDLATKHEAVVIFIPVRLGMDSFNLNYERTIKDFLNCRHSLGIIGGKPKHSLYFIGYQGSNLIYLDPHFCQATVEVDNADFELKTYHCEFPQKTAFSTIDPSLAFGFFFRLTEDIAEIQDTLKRFHNVFALSPERFAEHQHQCSQLDDIISAPDFSSVQRSKKVASKGAEVANSSMWYVPPQPQQQHQRHQNQRRTGSSSSSSRAHEQQQQQQNRLRHGHHAASANELDDFVTIPQCPRPPPASSSNASS